LHWISLAAQQDHPAAQDNLGWMFETVKDTEKNIAKAIYWYRKATINGHASK
jgi:hypothetical protein|tara:strand:+ start:1235 stop:1390 length:156 start_codon:yes stop_codon:yes gene_type:complete